MVSGKYSKGMKVGHSPRFKGAKNYNLAQAEALFGNDSESVEVAYPLVMSLESIILVILQLAIHSTTQEPSNLAI